MKRTKPTTKKTTKQTRKRKPPHDARLHPSRLSTMSESTAVCVTICTPAYAHLRAEAVESFRKHLGLPVLVIECDDAEGYETKMKLDWLVGPRIMVFCDIDWRPMRAVPAVWTTGEWCAVRDHGYKHPHSFASHDIEAHGLNPQMYFNSGFFTCDLAKPQHAAVFSTARAIWRDVQQQKRPAVGDFGDQFYLNAAAQELGIAARMLPVSFNWLEGYANHGMMPYRPRIAYAVHAAGVPLPDKQAHLQSATVIYGQPAGFLCQGVAEELLTNCVELP